MRRRQYVQSHQFKSVCAMPLLHAFSYCFFFRFSLTYYIMFCVVCQVAQTAIIVIIIVASCSVYEYDDVYREPVRYKAVWYQQQSSHFVSSGIAFYGSRSLIYQI